jgi:CSLREA domain-containing protein
MDPLTFAPAPLLRRLSSLGLSFGLALAALLLLGRAVGAATAASPAAGGPAALSQPAVTFVVTATADSDDNDLADGHCHDVLNGGCSLRAAVQQLDHDAGGNITLPAGTFNLTNDSDGDLQLQKDITITGASAALTLIQGNPVTWTHRMLRVQSGAHVFLNGVTISGGYLPAGNGGGINVVSGNLTLYSVVVRNNTADTGGAIYNSGTLNVYYGSLTGNHSSYDGGGLYNSVGATATLVVSAVTSNTTAYNGGGVDNLGTMTISHSTVGYNTAGVLHASFGTGGGVANQLTGTLLIEYSTLNNNRLVGPVGGGLANQGTTASTTIVNSTVDGNQVKSNTTSLDMPQGLFDAVGGGIANISGLVDLSNVTVTSNTVQGNSNGGGIYANILHGTTTTVRNTLVALNVAMGGVGPDCGGALQSQGYNLVQSTLGCLISGTTTGNITGQDPKLKPLGNYGSSAETRDLLPGSPAIDAGNPSGCLDSLGQLVSLDQNSKPRPSGPFCDIGAVEGASPLIRRLLLPLLSR